MVREQELDVATDNRRKRHGGQPRLACSGIEIEFGTAEVLRREPGMDAIPDHGALTNQDDPRRSWRNARVAASGIQMAGRRFTRASSASLRASMGSVFARACQMSLTW